MKYFGETIINGEWEKAENYLSAFTRLEDSLLSRKMFFEMRKQKYFEAIFRNDLAEAATIFRKGLSVFLAPQDENYEKLTEVLTSKSIRRNEFLMKYLDAYSLRVDLFYGLNQLLGRYPVLLDKLNFPCMDKSRLLTIFKQIMDWWVPHYNNARFNLSLDMIPKIPSLFHGQSVLIINSSSLKTDESGIPRNCWSNDRSCMTDLDSGVMLKTSEKSESPASEMFTSQKAMEISVMTRGSNCQMDIDGGVGTIAEMNKPSDCCLLVLPDNSLVARVARLTYSSSGDAIFALAQNGIHKLWLLQDNEHSSGKAIADIQPHLHQPLNGKVMRNNIGANPESTIACLVLKGHHLVSSSGGLISIYDVQTFEKMTTFGFPPPVATYFILLPQDIFAVGFDDSTVLIRHAKETKATLKGHQNAVTCLAFSYNLNVLVSSGADAQLCVWDVEGWEKIANKSLQSFGTGQVPDPPVVNYIEFHQDQIRFLSVHEKQIDIYEAPMLNHLIQSVPPECDLPITNATYSCDCQSIFVSFKSGCIKVMDSETLEPRCRISPTAFAQQIPSSLEVYPTVVAAHPCKPNQIAIGLSNGRVLVLEPIRSEKEWNMCSNDGSAAT